MDLTHELKRFPRDSEDRCRYCGRLASEIDSEICRSSVNGGYSGGPETSTRFKSLARGVVAGAEELLSKTRRKT